MKTSEWFSALCLIDTPEALINLADAYTTDDDLQTFHCAPDRLSRTNKTLVLFGAGNFARLVLMAWQKAGITPAYCVDNNPALQGSTVLGVPIHSPAALEANPEGVIVVIAAMQTHDIQRWLKIRRIPHLFAEMDGSIGALPGHRLMRRRHEVIEAWQAFGDTRSRAVFLAALKARLFQQIWFDMIGNPFLHHVATGAQYFVPELAPYSNRRAFVDCGAFDGDFLVSLECYFRRNGQDSPEVHAFEADQLNFVQLQNTVSAFDLKRVVLHHTLIGSRDDWIKNPDFNNCRTGEKPAPVQATRLDTVLADVDVGFIKMDIEGAEIDALKGAEKIIFKHKPFLAVCCYHTTDQLLDVPLYIKHRHPDYTLYCHHHSPTTLWETVCYGIPT